METEHQPTSLDTLLEGKTEQPQPHADKAPEPEPETQEQGADAKGDDAEGKTSDEGETPAPEKADDKGKEGEKSVPLEALLDERQKRQEAERRAAELEQKRNESNPRPDPYEDPDGAAQWDRDQQDQNLFDMRVSMSKEIMRQAHPDDYDEAEAAFLDAANTNPALAVQLREHPMPAKYAYEEGKRQLLLKEIGDDPEAYQQRLRKQISDELKAELKAEQEDEQPDDQSQAKEAEIPQSLADAGSSSAGRREASKWDGPKPIETLLK